MDDIELKIKLIEIRLRRNSELKEVEDKYIEANGQFNVGDEVTLLIPPFGTGIVELVKVYPDVNIIDDKSTIDIQYHVRKEGRGLVTCRLQHLVK